MAAEAGQVLGAGGEPGVEVVGGDAAARAPARIAVERDHHARAAVALDQPRRDDADDAGVPALPRHDQRRPVELGQAGGLGLDQDAQLLVAPLAVERVELLGHRRGPLLVVGQQQLERGVGAAQAPRGVQPRTQPEAERLLVDLAGLERGHPHQGPQPRLARAARARARPSRTIRRFSPRSGTRSQTVASAARSRSSRGPGGIQAGGRARRRLRELERHAGGAQLGRRVGAEGRVHDRAVGELRARAVVVGHEHVHAQRPGGGDLGHGGDPAVHRHEQLDALGGEAARPAAADSP